MDGNLCFEYPLTRLYSELQAKQLRERIVSSGLQVDRLLTEPAKCSSALEPLPVLNLIRIHECTPWESLGEGEACLGQARGEIKLGDDLPVRARTFQGAAQQPGRCLNAGAIAQLAIAPLTELEMELMRDRLGSRDKGRGRDLSLIHI
eukprot:TRINITY_DN21902_c0_g1_i1.p2 TRINITY_DN21902_c0_g1~~TRINITY_DN21902_c0_g1_i1.p2  ORF type:complete len:148 (-),score=24.37 TRINITY_DN21902_c0_g1_i1:133-576(-)